jgi:Tfp pilus assembly protein PilF
LEKQRAEATASPRDALIEAVSLLDDGQVDEARTLLEEALVNDPGNALVEAHLLEIYRRSHNQTAFLKMRERLGRTGAALSEVWEKSEAA